MVTKDEIEECLEEGGMRARLLIELLGKPKEHVEETLKLVAKRLSEEDGVKILKEEIFEATVQEESEMFACFAEVEILVKDFATLTGACFYYLPSSVEILEPAEKHMQCTEITQLITDLLGKLHELDMELKNLRAENDIHKANMGKLLKNSIRALLEKERTAKEIADALKIPQDQAEVILERMQEQKLITVNGNKFSSQ